MANSSEATTVVPSDTLYEISFKDAIYCGYNPQVEKIRNEEYPFLSNTTYLDHSGATLYPTSVVDRSATILKTQLLGNPHSGSPSSMLATRHVNQVRKQVLQFFNANESEWDIVFVANATAGIKLVADGFAGASDGNGFKYRYHQDSHTSLIGVRELTKDWSCMDDEEVNKWLEDREEKAFSEKAGGWITSTARRVARTLQCFPISSSDSTSEGTNMDISTISSPSLFAYPAQSNLTGRRLPLHWPTLAKRKGFLTMLDASAILMTKPLDLSPFNTPHAPDYIVFSFYKIFGLPDLGGVLVKRDGPAASILHKRKFYGGGTVEKLTAREGFSSTRTAENGYSPHDGLEDGSLPWHSIVMLGVAIRRHMELYCSGQYGVDAVGKHTGALSWAMYHKLKNLRHYNGKPVVEFYSTSHYLTTTLQGPVLCFNILDSRGAYVGFHTVEREATDAGIHIRVGGNCNPGGVDRILGLGEGGLLNAYIRDGKSCGDDVDVLPESGRPVGAVRVSLGAVTTWEDVLVFVEFVRSRWVDYGPRKEGSADMNMI